MPARQRSLADGGLQSDASRFESERSGRLASLGNDGESSRRDWPGGDFGVLMPLARRPANVKLSDTTSNHLRPRSLPMRPSHPNRRAFLQVGYSGLLGLGLPGLMAARAAASTLTTVARPGRAKSVIVILLSGGLGQHDSFDMKPEAPDGIRGDFKPIATAVPGLRICEHLPMLAARMNKLAVVRSMAHPEGNHLLAVHRVLTGHGVEPQGGQRPRPGGLPRRLPLLRRRARPGPPAGRRHPQRRQPAAPAGRRPADLARPGRRLPRAEARPLAAPARPEQARVEGRQPRPPRRPRRRPAPPPSAPDGPDGGLDRTPTPSSTSKTPRSPCSATAGSARRSTSTARTRGSSTATASTSSAGRS